MVYLRRSVSLFVLALSAVLFVADSLAQEAADVLIKQGEIQEDLYLAGGSVRVVSDVTGDVIVAGGRVTVGRRVNGDIAAAAGSVLINAEVTDDVRVAGGDVTIDGVIHGDAIAAGGSVSLTPGARVGGRTWLSGGLVEVAGEVDGELKISAGRVIISGKVGGNTIIFAQSLEVLPGAVLSGDLQYSVSGDAVIAPDALISGAVTQLQSSDREQWRAVYATAFASAALFVLFLGVVLTTVVLFLLFNQLFQNSSVIMRQQSLGSIGLGFVVFILTPAVMGLLMFLLVGIPLGLILLFLYGLLLLLAFFIAVYFVSDRGLAWIRPAKLSSTGWRILSIAVAVLLWGLVGLIPFIGGILLMLVFLAALGALGQSLYKARHLSVPAAE